VDESVALRLAIIDKRIMWHIGMNGRITDQVGMQLAMQFVQEALKDPTISKAARQYGFTSEDLVVIYGAMVEGLLPNPCIEGGGPMLAATLPFMEPFRIESLMGRVHRQLEPAHQRAERREIIVQAALEEARGMWNTHTMARGRRLSASIPPVPAYRLRFCPGIRFRCLENGMAKESAASWDGKKEARWSSSRCSWSSRR
jgi:hypothetical protein